MPNLSTWVLSVEILYLLGMQASSIQDANENDIFVQTVFKVVVSETEIIPFLLCIFLTLQNWAKAQFSSWWQLLNPSCDLCHLLVFYFSNITERISHMTHLLSSLASAANICDKSFCFVDLGGRLQGHLIKPLQNQTKKPRGCKAKLFFSTYCGTLPSHTNCA